MGVRCWVIWAGMASISSGAFVNLDFEEIEDASLGVASASTGWRLMGPLGPGLDGMPNLSGWAEGYRTSRQGLGVSMVISGDHSVAFESGYARNVTVRDSWPGWEALGYRGDEIIGAVFIAQTGWIPAGVSAIRFLTDYTGPRLPEPSDPPMAQDVGELAVYVDDQPIAFRIEPYDASGWTLNWIVGDLTPFAGRLGEIRIGVEGPHRFVIDQVQFVGVPESGAVWGVGVGAFLSALGYVARRWFRDA